MITQGTTIGRIIMIRKSFTAAIAIATLATSGMVSANLDRSTTMSNFNYDHFDARIGIAPITFGGGLSKSIHPNAHFLATIDSELDEDYNARVGVGFHAPINNWADLTGAMVLRVAALSDESTDTGMEINVGIRQWLGPQLEVGGDVGFLTLFDKEDLIGNVYARFHATDLFSIGLEGKINDIYGNQFMLTTRFNL